MMVHFVIPGCPFGKGSFRSGKYTDAKTRNYIKRAGAEYRKQVGYTFPDDALLEIGIVAYYQIPTSETKKKKALMADGVTVPGKAPDWDNIAKAVCDSLQPGKINTERTAFKNDARIVVGTVVKKYSLVPRVEVWIREWQGARKEWWDS